MSPVPPPETLMLLDSLVCADLVKKRCIILRHREVLLAESLIRFLADYIERLSEGPDREVLIWNATLLDDCRVHGTFPTFDVLARHHPELGEPLPERPPATHRLVAELVNLPFAEKMAFVAAHRAELVDPVIVAGLRRTAEGIDNRETQLDFEFHANLLEQCERDGLDVVAQAMAASVDLQAMTAALDAITPDDLPIAEEIAAGWRATLTRAADGGGGEYVARVEVMRTLNALRDRFDDAAIARFAADNYAALAPLAAARGDMDLERVLIHEQVNALVQHGRLADAPAPLIEALAAKDAWFARCGGALAPALRLASQVHRNAVAVRLAKMRQDRDALEAGVAFCNDHADAARCVEPAAVWLENQQALEIALSSLADLTREAGLLLDAAEASRAMAAALDGGDQPDLRVEALVARGGALRTFAERTGDVRVLADNIRELHAALADMGQVGERHLVARLTEVVASNVSRLATMTDDSARFQASLELFDDAVALAAELSPKRRAELLTNRGTARGELGEARGVRTMLVGAVADLEAALALTPPDQRADRALVQHNVATTLHELGKYRDGDADLRRAVAMFRDVRRERTALGLDADLRITEMGLAAALHTLGARDGDIGPVVEAVALADELAATLTADAAPELFAAVMRNRGIACRTLARLLPADAQRHLTAAAESFRRARETGLFRVGLGIDHGMALLALAEWDNAADLLAAELRAGTATALASPTAGEQDRIIARLTGVADAIAYARLRAGRYDEALAAVSNGRGLRIALSIALRQAPGGASRFTPLREAWASASRRLVAVERELTEVTPSRDVEATSALRNERDAIRRELKKQQDAIAAMIERAGFRSSWSPDAAALGAALPPSSVLAIPIIGPTGGALLLVEHGCRALTPAHVHLLDELDGDRIAALLFGRADDGPEAALSGWFGAYERFRNALTDHRIAADELARWNACVEAGLDTLATLLMEPLDRHLRDLGIAPGTEVILMPPGRLGVLPLASAGRRDGSGRWRCFVDRWPTRLVPGLDVLRRPAHGADGAEVLLGVTDPLEDLGVSDNPAGAAFPLSRRVELYGPAATVPAVLGALPRASHLSFYCHGLFDPGDPLGSGLLLAGANGQERETLTVSRLRQLDLSAVRMAILGACETALVDVGTFPDEFVGLPAALLEAGAGAVLASTWLVEQRATHALIARFVDLHLAGASSAEALRQAMLEVRDGVRVQGGMQFGTRHSQPAAAADVGGVLPDAAFFWAAFGVWGQ